MPVAEHVIPADETRSATLCLLGGPFVIKNGRQLEIPESSKRLVVFVALHGGRVNRRHAAGTLWPRGEDSRAAANLRSALWRLRAADINVLYSDKYALFLDSQLSVDITQLSQWATRIIDGSAEAVDLRQPSFSAEAVDLLPGWCDDWVLLARERLRQRLLHAMEALVRRLIGLGQYADAVETAITAVSAEPLRESAQRVLIDAHLAESNYVEACRVFEAYSQLLAIELGVSPSEELSEIVRNAASPIAQVSRIRTASMPRVVSTTGRPARSRQSTGQSELRRWSSS
jgi:DNA-binding SARP family transcriptional activator